MFERLITLIEEENLKLIQEKKILLIGLGGVGSYALEGLIRNGFTNIVVADYDIIEKSNLNRQLLTTLKNIGHSKVLEAIIRAKQINPNILIEGHEKKLTRDNIDELLNLNFDYIIDACDSLEVKFALMEKSLHYSYKLITCMGTANKLDPTKLEITTLDKTKNDPLARILRKKVKEANINKKFICISSTEVPKKIKNLGTSSLVPSVAGIYCVSYILNRIIKK